MSFVFRENKKIQNELNLYEKPQKIFVKNKKMNLDELTKKIAERYNITIKDDIDKNKHFRKNSDKQKIVGYNGNKNFSDKNFLQPKFFHFIF